ncbi:MAG: hypothetical protein BroJett011_13400 [Chloroflexota bacterium]|nr:MAG: hypothetical protein BroJett011_13400 [Chloroflexota bacterium]
MGHKSVDQLSIEELEALIRLRRASGKQTTLTQPPVIRPRRRWWERWLLLAELGVIVVLLLFASISARGWLALRQKLPLDGVTLVDEQVRAAQPADSTETKTLPPIGWRKEARAEQTSATGIETQNQLLETPEHLKRWLQPRSASPPVSLPEPVAQPPTRILIPAIGVDAPVGEGTDWESLKYKVGHHPGTANPGQRGNMVLAAHNDVYGEIFRYLPDVPVGEVITVYAGEESFRYRLTERRIIRPEQTEVMLPTTGPTVTLISCYPYLIDTYRIILFGELVEEI